jgi:hypothetical protein
VVAADSGAVAAEEAAAGTVSHFNPASVQAGSITHRLLDRRLHFPRLALIANCSQVQVLIFFFPRGPADSSTGPFFSGAWT